jgi:hypothetical protein
VGVREQKGACRALVVLLIFGAFGVRCMVAFFGACCRSKVYVALGPHPDASPQPAVTTGPLSELSPGPGHAKYAMLLRLLPRGQTCQCIAATRWWL